MNRPPRDSKDGIFSGGLGFDVVYQGILVTVITIAAYLIGAWIEFKPVAGSGWFTHMIGLEKNFSEHGMTMAFLAMSMCEIFHSFNLRSQRKSVFTLKSQNKILWAAMLGSLVLTTLVLEVPVLAAAFGFTPVGFAEYAVALLLAATVIPLVECVKLLQRKLGK
jgi:Ca2+-transporting ATPase